MMLFQSAPANTTSYMIAGYAVIFGVILLYILSMVIRQHNLMQELQILEQEASSTTLTE